MNHNINRRDFLKHTAAATVILGFPFFSRFADADDAPDFLAEALARMKDERKPGVLILIPKDAGQANVLASVLAHILTPQNGAAHQIFCEAVVACVPTKTAARIEGVKADWTVVCLDASGKVIDGAALPINQCNEKLIPLATQILHGKDNERLKSAAQSQREKLDDKTFDRVRKAIENLGAQSSRLRELASQELVELAPRAPAILALAAVTTADAEVKARAASIFETIFESAPDDKPSACLPFGAKWEGRMVKAQPVDPCHACGMAVMPDASRKFLRFVTEK